MSEQLPTAGVQSGLIIVTSLVSGVDAGLLHVLIGSVGGALAARVFAPIQDIPLTFLKSFTIFICSIMMAGIFGGFFIELLVAQEWVKNSTYTRVAIGAMIGMSAQAIAELLQSIPKIAQANLIDVTKAIFSRITGKGVV